MRWAVAVLSLLIVVSAAVGAVRLYERTIADHGSVVREDGERLRDIRTLLGGSTLQQSRRGCVRYLEIDTTRNAHQYPPKGSADYESIMRNCSGGLP